MVGGLVLDCYLNLVHVPPVVARLIANGVYGVTGDHVLGHVELELEPNKNLFLF